MKVQHIREVRAFNRYYTRVIGLLDNHYLQSNYSLPEVRVMYELYHHPETTPSDIIQQLGMDKGYLSRIIQSFVKNKIVRKSVSATDKRSVFEYGFRKTIG
jgi:DNA-binding MarR family transcriptional regulator